MAKNINIYQGNKKKPPRRVVILLTSVATQSPTPIVLYCKNPSRHCKVTTFFEITKGYG